jgi:DNA polymerase elongation subunit (family B)/thymidylate kinase
MSIICPIVWYSDNGNFYLSGYTLNDERCVVKIPNVKTKIYLEVEKRFHNEEGINLILERVQGYNIRLSIEEESYTLFGHLTIYCFEVITDFNGLNALRRLSNTLKIFPIKLHETDFDERLRYVAERSIKLSDWICVIGTEKTKKLNNDTKIFIADKIEKVNHPINQTITPKIFVFDIECEQIVNEEDNENDDEDSSVEDIDINRNLVFQISIVINMEKIYLLSIYDVNIEKLKSKKRNIQHVELFVLKDEEELLLKFFDLIRLEDPDVITGYNILQFDWKVIMKTSDKYDSTAKSFQNISRCGIKTKRINREWESSAYGKKNLSYPEIEGRCNIDLYQLISREYRMKSTLDNVAEQFIGEKKLDVDYKLIFLFSRLCRNPKENLEKQLKPYDYYKLVAKTLQINSLKYGITKIAKYCIIDSYLVYKLFYKLQVFEKTLELSKICNVPIDDVYSRGNTIRGFSLLFTESRNHNIIMNEAEGQFKHINEEMFGRYTGAFVLDPQKGLHDNVFTLDFNSLYPSIMINMNICYSTIILDSDYNGQQCHNVQTSYGNFRFTTEYEGLIPKICKKLIETRKEIKKERDSYNKDSSEYKLLNTRQDVLKIIVNAIYGQLGTRYGKRRLIPAALCVTQIGQQLLKEAKANIVSKGFEVIYGDSVPGYTPVLLFNDKTGDIEVITIDSIAKWGRSWKRDLYDKEYYHPKKYWAWTHKGFSKIRRVIKHKCSKKLYRIYTVRGIVDVTEDHSLITSTYEVIKPLESLGTTLLTSFPSFGLPISESYGVLTTKYDQVSCQRFYRNYKNAGYELILSCYKPDCYTIESQTDNRPSGLVIKIEYIGTLNNEEVYDLDTEVGAFQAGIGEIIVHNTDSTMVKLHYDPRNYLDKIRDIKTEDLFKDDLFRENYEESLINNPIDIFYEKRLKRIGQSLSKEITDEINLKNNSNYNIEFEKFYTKFLITDKKCYDAMVLGTGEIIHKGGVVVKRNYPEILKQSYSKILKAIFENRNVIDVFSEEAREILREVNIFKFINSATFKDFKSYADKISDVYRDKDGIPIDEPISENDSRLYFKNKQYGLVLAIAMNNRGEVIPYHSRIDYLLIKTCNWEKEPKFKSVEEYKYFYSNKSILKLNRLMYLQILQNPVQKLLDSLVDIPIKINLKVLPYQERFYKKHKISIYRTIPRKTFTSTGLIYYHYSLFDKTMDTINKFIIAFEGPDGSGKTTQANYLSETLDIPVFHFPNRNSRAGKRIDNYLNNREEISKEELYQLFLEDKYQSMVKLPQSKIIILDRYISSGIVGAKANGIPEVIYKREKDLPIPTITFVLEKVSNKSINKLDKDEQFQEKCSKLFMEDENIYSKEIYRVNSSDKIQIHNAIVAIVKEGLQKVRLL